jgi:transposase
VADELPLLEERVGPVVLVDRGRLGAVPAGVEELGERGALDVRDRAHIDPRRVRGSQDLRLRGEVLARMLLKPRARLSERCSVLVVLAARNLLLLSSHFATLVPKFKAM